MKTRSSFMFFIVFFSILALAECWSGNYCNRIAVRYDSRRECSFRLWFICCSYRTVWYPVYYIELFCCPGWTTSWSEVCDVPVCNPPCQNGGTCIAPDQCRCQVQNTGSRCDGSTCSHLAPCYPGTCQAPDSCDCSSGFSTATSWSNSITKQNYCLKIEDNRYTEVQIYQMQVRMSYWPRDAPTTEQYQIMADSSDLKGATDFFWINRKDFNRLETNCSSQFFLPTLPPRPLYIGNASFGIVKGEIQVWLSKLPISPATERFQSLNKTIPCTISVSSFQPESQLYKCDIVDRNFDRFLEHGDFLKVTYKTTGGGFRELLNRNPVPPMTYATQPYVGVERTLAVEFRFDFRPPFHCGESNQNGCSNRQSILQVPDVTKNIPVTIQWNDWQDNDSKMFRYSMEVFKMTKTIDNELEIKPELALKPLINREVMHEALTAQQFTFPEPGMYSIILEAADLANNSKYVRRLCLFDPSSNITTDSNYGLYVTSASEAAHYSYQSNRSRSIVVMWDQYFRNDLHETNALLGAVREYPRELENSKKYIPKNSPLDDNEGRRTVNEIPNKRGIINFQVAYDKDHEGGLSQPAEPTAVWNDVYLNTTFTVPLFPSEADTITVWVIATDFMGNRKMERTKVTFDSTAPQVQNIEVHVNAPVPGIDFSSKFSVSVQDIQSGIAYILWTFTRKNGTVLYEQRVSGRRVPENECMDFKSCSCTTAKECFPHEQSLFLNNCKLMVEKDSLAIENLTITANVFNMAGLVTTSTTYKGDLHTLNGTQAYYPPQNIRVKNINSEGVTLTWDFPPSCFRRTELWVKVDSDKRVVHKDAVQFDLTGLRPSTNYTIYMVTYYEGGETSDPQPFSFKTGKAEVTDFGGGAIAGIVIGCLILLALVVFILMFVLWKRGVFFQRKESPVNKGMERVSTAFTKVRNTLRYRHNDVEGQHGSYSNAVYNPEDEVYQYGHMTFAKKPKWELDDDCLSLIDILNEGRFAQIFKANLRGHGKTEIVVAKMLKSGFTEEDQLIMKAKINFMATKLKRHENILKFVGAITTNLLRGPVMILEYCEGGQLDHWLLAHNTNIGDETMEHLFRFTLGIAKAMAFLASSQVTHERLAARNVLLTSSSEPEVKVSGFGPKNVAKNVAQDNTSRVPVKWVAPEILEEKPATEKSDVWSYGVVLWEIFSMGLKPYPEISSREIGTHLKEGHRLAKPECADDMFYQLMKDCWQEVPDKRPTFQAISKQLASLFKSNDSVYYDIKRFRN